MTSDSIEAGTALAMTKSGPIDVESALDMLKRAMLKDADYAWSWHCAIAVSMLDEGVDHAVANRGAVRFMRMAFQVDTGLRLGQEAFLDGDKAESKELGSTIPKEVIKSPPTKPTPTAIRLNWE